MSKTQNDSTDLYSIEAFIVLDVKSIRSPDSTVDIGCELNIANANYTVTKVDTYEVNSKYSECVLFLFV